MIFYQQRGDLAQTLDPIVREVENLYALVVHERPENFLRVLAMVEVHPREPELLQRFNVLNIADQLRDGAVADVTLVED